MDGYTFEEGVAFLVLVNAPRGVINHIKATHNRNQLHSEIHKHLRMPRTLRILKEKGFGMENKGNVPQISQDFQNDVTDTNPTENVTETPESGTVPEENVPENDKSGTEETEVSTEASTEADNDETEIILTKEDLSGHKYTRLDQMPNDLCRTLWLKRQDVYREMQQAHLKMRSVPEGEEHNEERAKWRNEVLRLDAENDNYWQQIDAEIERFTAENERADEKADKEEQPGFNVSTYRSYISKAVRKKELSAAQLSELQHRVDAMLAAKLEFDTETIGKLKGLGIKVG